MAAVTILFHKLPGLQDSRLDFCIGSGWLSITNNVSKTEVVFEDNFSRNRVPRGGAWHRSNVSSVD
jgi:hypothetical protein